MPDNAISANAIRPVDLQPQSFTLQLNGGTEAIVTAAVPRPLDLTLESHTISVGPGVETVVNIAAPRKVVSLLQFGVPGTDGAPGIDADQVEFQVAVTMLQWRRVGQVLWNDLVDLTTVVPGSLWGLIGGTLTDQADLVAALNAVLASAAALDAAHLAAGDPHPQYLTSAEGNAVYSFLGHTHLLANLTDVTMTVANLNALDDGANTALHFHDADRARANHTGTQLAATISDFNSAADARVAAGNALTATAWQTGRTITLTGMVTGVSAAFNGTANLSFVASLGSFTMAQLDAAVSDGNVSYAGHTHLLANLTDVTITVANLNALDDGANTALHFHDADRARANHTGTQLAATISDFNSAADARIAAANKHTNIAFQDEGSGLGTAGTVNTINFTGAGVAASRVGDVMTVAVSGGGGGSVTIETAEVDFATPAKSRFFDVVVAAAVLGHKVIASPSLSMPAGVAEDELEMDPISVSGHVIVTGQVRLLVASVNGGTLGGKRNINLILA